MNDKLLKAKLYNTPSTVIKLSITGIIDRGGILQLIDRETSCWAFIDNRYRNLIDFLNSKDKTISQIFNEFSFRKENIIEKIIYLYESGLLLIDNQSIISREALYTKPIFKPFFAVINVTDLCNMKCNYCYYPTKTKNKITSDMIVRIANEFLNFNSSIETKISICFHGGEPLLCFDQIKNACKRIIKLDRSGQINFLIQTNGTLLNKEKASFLNDYNFHVGVSIDGPEELHNYHRITKSGKNGFKDSMNGIYLLQKYNVKFGVITVLTSNNIAHTDNIIEFFVQNGILNCNMNPLFNIPESNIYDRKIYYNPDYLSAVKKIYHKINSIKKAVKFNETELSSLVTNIVTLNRDYMCARYPCGAGNNVLSFEPNGDIFPCDSLSREDKYKIGNIIYDSFSDLKNSTNKFYKEISDANITQCDVCQYKYICKRMSYCQTGDIQSYDSDYCAYSYNIIDFLMDEIAQNRLDVEYFLGKTEQLIY